MPRDAKTIAVLYVEKGGVYYGLEGVDPWDAERDARKYDGPYPVVAHPPCGRWSRSLAPLNERRWGVKVGDDGGCFAHALACVERFGGILEHPAQSLAWERYKLPIPPRVGWIKDAFTGAWVGAVYQGAYGHKARKKTWLYARVRDPGVLSMANPKPSATISGMLYDHGKPPPLPMLGKREASRTPLEFRDYLIQVARNAA